MRKIGDLPVKGLQLGGDRFELGLPGLRFFAQEPPFFLQRLALGLVLGLADRLRGLVRLPVELFHFDLEEFSCFFELNEAVNIDIHSAVVQFCVTSSAFSTINRRSSMGSSG